MIHLINVKSIFHYHKKPFSTNSEYHNNIMIKIRKLRQKYKLFDNYNLPKNFEKEKELQLSLFD